MSNDTAKSLRNIVAQFPVPKGTIQLLVVCSRAFIKAVRRTYNIMYRKGGGKREKHPHTCDKRNTQEYKIIDSIHNTMMAKDRQKKGDGGREIKFRS